MLPLPTLHQAFVKYCPPCQHLYANVSEAQSTPWWSHGSALELSFDELFGYSALQTADCTHVTNLLPVVPVRVRLVGY
jgi:hypothetical protein